MTCRLSLTSAGLLTAGALAFVPAARSGVLFQDPAGGWDYVFSGDAADPTPGAALDGSWDYSNGSSSWSGDPPNEPGNPDGGVGVVAVDGEVGNNALLIVDSKTADPNRKIALLRDLGSSIPADPFLDDGFTLSLRARLPSIVPDLGTAPDGYTLHDGNKGMFIVRQSGGTVSMTLGMASRDAAFATPGDGLMIADGDSAVQFIPLDPTSWNELWITVVQNVNDPARYDLTVWNNGVTDTPVFQGDVALATGTETTFPTYMAMQLGATGQVGAVEVDFFAVKDGVHPPPPPSPGDLLTRFQADPAAINPGQSSTLRWTVEPGATVAISPGLGNVTDRTDAAGSGSIVVTPAKTTSYAIDVTKGGQSEQGNTSVVVRMVQSLDPSQTYYAPGGQVGLNWVVRPGATVTITPGVGNVTAQTNPTTGVGSINVSPSGVSATYTIEATEGAETGQASVTLVRRLPSTQVFTDPAGGWGCAYDGAAVPTEVGWSAVNGSSTFAGNAPGSGDFPGGAGVFTEGADTFLRIQDTGDPTDYGMPDPSNRKIYFTLPLTDCLPDGYAPLTEGVTMHLRARVPTTGTLDLNYPDGGGGPIEYPAGGDGYTIFAGGKGQLGIRQEGIDPAPSGIVSWSLSTESTGGGADTTAGINGLVMNALNGTTTSGTINTGEGTPNEALFDPTVWHEMWITLVADESGGGSHRLDLWLDGAATPTTYHLTAGNGTETVGLPYLAMGCGATGGSGAIDVDYFNLKAGVLEPQTSAPATPFVITAATRNPATGELTLTWSSTTGASYSVQASDTLTAWPVTVVSGLVATGSSTTFTVPAAQAGTGSRYFRVVR